MTTRDGLLMAAKICERKMGYDPIIQATRNTDAHAFRALAEQEPEGWVSVPIEPTDTMVGAISATFYKYRFGDDKQSEHGTEIAQMAYKAMLTAAPTESTAAQTSGSPPILSESNSVNDSLSAPAVPPAPMPKEPQIMQMWGIENKYIPVVGKADYDALRAHAEALLLANANLRLEIERRVKVNMEEADKTEAELAAFRPVISLLERIRNVLVTTSADFMPITNAERDQLLSDITSALAAAIARYWVSDSPLRCVSAIEHALREAGVTAEEK